MHTLDGAVHLMIGDVSGHGADEAALGVCLRVAWRTLTLARQRTVERVLPTLQDVLIHERHAEEIFATVSTVTITPDRMTAAVRSAGHPPPVLLGEDDGGAPTIGPTATGPAARRVRRRRLAGAPSSRSSQRWAPAAPTPTA